MELSNHAIFANSLDLSGPKRVTLSAVEKQGVVVFECTAVQLRDETPCYKA